ncbi:alpha/beta fold hydrolase [Nocardioides allogilvus]|uniref:alpha/beta fold hydrolase n=1 Tax=Nocardioides allogilvus TaxID=2072017 RepID=UPI001E2FFF99|nr:alpha/beta hydrolase [Nocardioides allogilvus]
MIWSRTCGRDDGPLLVMLHGLGATAEVYADACALLPSRWPGGWLVVDLPGHGRSSWDAPYTFRRHAEGVLSVLPLDREIVVLGHSMGGVVALELATDPRVRGVVAFGVKVSWPPSDVAGAERVAARPVQVLATREEAVGRYLRLAGLSDLVAPDSSSVAPGVVAVDDGCRVAQDPATFGVGVPAMTGLLAGARCPVVLARGEHDAMVSDADLADLVPDPVTLPGLGHNAHVEDPGAVLGLVDRLLAG